MQPTELHKLGRRHGTDKAQIFHNGRSYLDIYEQYLRPIRRDVRSVLELGVKGGASLRVWEEFFPNAEIFGLDIDPGAAKHAGGRKHVVIGGQDSPQAAAKLSNAGTQLVKGFKGFDIVIDDASHLNELTLASFAIYFPRLAYRGIYVIEDLATSYKDLTPHFRGWPGGKYVRKSVSLKNHRADMDKLFAHLIKEMDMLPEFGTRDTRKSRISTIHFWSRIVFILK